jgi:hypothetical protein
MLFAHRAQDAASGGCCRGVLLILHVSTVKTDAWTRKQAVRCLQVRKDEHAS